MILIGSGSGGGLPAYRLSETSGDGSYGVQS
jgi:choline dehydrogenase-like flavoprotein